MSTAVRNRVAFDSTWLGRCREGDLAAWRGLYERHFEMVHRVAARMGVPPIDLADVCQEVFLRVYRGLGSFRDEAQFTTWLYSIVVREASRARRSGLVRQTLLTLLGRQPPEPARDPLSRAEATWELERVLRHLKPKHRQALVLFDLEELSLEEVAAALGCPLETVRSRLRHARAEFSRFRRLEAAR